jgi:hypothetical protein
MVMGEPDVGHGNWAVLMEGILRAARRSDELFAPSRAQ